MFIQLLCHEGNVLVIEDGKVVNEFYCDYDISTDMQDYLDKNIPEYKTYVDGES